MKLRKMFTSIVHNIFATTDNIPRFIDTVEELFEPSDTHTWASQLFPFLLRIPG